MDRASSSDSSSDSPPHITGTDDDLILETVPDAFIASGFKDTFTAHMKRGPPGRHIQYGGGEGARESKARRKETRGGPGSGSLWDAMGTGSHPQVRQKDELVDQALADQLRSQFGDPFDDSVLKKSAGSEA